MWETKLYTACAYLILEKLLERLYEFELEVIRETTYVVV